MNANIGNDWLKAVSRIELDPAELNEERLTKVSFVLAKAGLTDILDDNSKLVWTRPPIKTAGTDQSRILEIPGLDPNVLNFPFSYAKPELCLEDSEWVTRNLVTRNPFIDFLKTMPELNHWRSDGSYKVVWSVVGNVAINAGVPIYATSPGRQRYFEKFGSEHDLRAKSKGIRPESFMDLRASIEDARSLAELMPTYHHRVLKDALSFIDIVVSDLSSVSEL